MTETLTLQFDGGSRGNPGPAGIGVVVAAEDGTPLVTLGRYIGRATNNVAEYTAVITALREARRLGAKKVRIRGDSELIIKQLKGEYRVKHPDMKVLYEQAMGLIEEFDAVEIGHNLRHKNELADKLANLAMDRKGEVTDVDDVPPPRGATAERASSAEPAAAGGAKAGDVLSCMKCGAIVEVKRPTSLRTHQPRPFSCQCGTPLRGPA